MKSRTSTDVLPQIVDKPNGAGAPQAPSDEGAVSEAD